MPTRPRILVVEDDTVLAIGLEGMLVNMGYDVAGLAVTGQKPDAIIMDIRLHGEMSGIEAARLLNERQRIPILYLTTYADETLMQQAKITGAYAYLNKPLRQHELRASIEMALYMQDADLRLRNRNRFLSALRYLGRLITLENDPPRFLARPARSCIRRTSTASSGSAKWTLPPSGHSPRPATVALSSRLSTRPPPPSRVAASRNGRGSDKADRGLRRPVER